MKTSNAPRYSFVIPTLNEVRHIEKCIAAIKSQAGIEVEIIVADNGSHDETVKIARAMGAKIVHVTQRGLSYARNQGAKIAQGKYVCFIDADGVISKNWFKHLEYILSKSDYDYVSGFNIFVHQKKYKFLLYNLYTLVAFSAVFVMDRLLGKTQLVGNNLVIKKGVFEKIGGFPAVVAEDVYLTQKVWRMKKYKGTFMLHMVVWYDSRGFDSAGFLHTLIYWAKSTFRPVSQENYAYNSKR